MNRLVEEQAAEMFRLNRPDESADAVWSVRHSAAEVREDEARQYGRLEQWETCVLDFADLAEQLAPAFNRARFLRVCGYTR